MQCVTYQACYGYVPRFTTCSNFMKQPCIPVGHVSAVLIISTANHIKPWWGVDVCRARPTAGMVGPHQNKKVITRQYGTHIWLVNACSTIKSFRGFVYECWGCHYNPVFSTNKTTVILDLVVLLF